MKVTNLLGDACNLPLKTGSVDLIVTHPPYLGTDVERYGGDPSLQINHSQNEKKMLKLLLHATHEMYRVLSANGTLVIANNEADGFDSKFMVQTLAKTGFNFAGYFVQDSTNRITVWQHYYKGDRPFMDYMGHRKHGELVFKCPFNNVDDKVDEKLDKEGFHVLDVMNRDVPTKFINMFTMQDDVVLDPFGGSGLVAVTAAKLGRIGITNDISETQHKAAARRIELSE